MSMDSAFKGCKNLVSLNIKNFIIDSKVRAKNIFEGCMTLIDYKPPMNNNIADILCIKCSSPKNNKENTIIVIALPKVVLITPK